MKNTKFFLIFLPILAGCSNTNKKNTINGLNRHCTTTTSSSSSTSFLEQTINRALNLRVYLNDMSHYDSVRSLQYALDTTIGLILDTSSHDYNRNHILKKLDLALNTCENGSIANYDYASLILNRFINSLGALAACPRAATAATAAADAAVDSLANSDGNARDRAASAAAAVDSLAAAAADAIDRAAAAAADAIDRSAAADAARDRATAATAAADAAVDSLANADGNARDRAASAAADAIDRASAADADGNARDRSASSDSDCILLEETIDQINLTDTTSSSGV
ncbi:hypothetical protein [Candidatus Cardinium hertigii]|uniref:hypothetical protein n=1 Tax=Candidatus Cardinium hertigii TaxID=247481 RepID=UPI003D7E04B4